MGYLKLLPVQHEKASLCVSDVAKLAVVLVESEYEVGRYFTTNHWTAVMEKIEVLPDVEWENDIDEIRHLYNNAITQLSSTMPTNELEQLIKDSKEGLPGDAGKVGALNVGKATGGILKHLKKCTSPKCIITAGFFGGIFKLFGNTIGDREAQRAMKYTEWTVKLYNIPNQISRTASDLADGFFANTGALTKSNFKHLERLKKAKMFFKKVSDMDLFKQVWKIKKIKETKAAAQLAEKLKTFKNWFNGKIVTALSTRLGKQLSSLGGKVGSALKTVALSIGKAGGKLAASIGKIVGKTAAKVATKFGLLFLDLGLAIWDIVDGVNTLKEGSKA